MPTLKDFESDLPDSVVITTDNIIYTVPEDTDVAFDQYTKSAIVRRLVIEMIEDYNRMGIANIQDGTYGVIGFLHSKKGQEIMYDRDSFENDSIDE